MSCRFLSNVGQSNAFRDRLDNGPDLDHFVAGELELDQPDGRKTVVMGNSTGFAGL